MRWLVLIALGTIWGASYLFIKVGGAEIPAFTFVAGRTTIASVVLGLVIVMRRERLPRITWQISAPLIAMGIFNSVIPYTLITWGETEISSGLAGILTAMMPIFTALFAHFMTSGDRLNVSKIAGIGVGLAGVVILFIPDLHADVKVSIIGELAVVAATISYGFSAVIAHKYVHAVSHISASFGQMLSASLLLVPLSLIVDRPVALHPSAAAVGSLVTLAVLGTALAYLLYYWLIEHTGATSTSLVTYIIPVSAIFLGVVVLNEHFDWTVFAGLAAIIAGVGLVTREAQTRVAIPVGVEAE